MVDNPTFPTALTYDEDKRLREIPASHVRELLRPAWASAFLMRREGHTYPAVATSIGVNPTRARHLITRACQVLLEKT